VRCSLVLAAMATFFVTGIPLCAKATPEPSGDDAFGLFIGQNPKWRSMGHGSQAFNETCTE